MLSTAVATISLRDEATELLQELIRLDTVNPPGNETRAAESRSRPMNLPAVIVMPERETPGISATLCATGPIRAATVLTASAPSMKANGNAGSRNRRYHHSSNDV